MLLSFLTQVVEAAVPIGLAAGLAALIGIDRQRLDKPAGIRTNVVVGVAAAAFAILSISIFDGDPSRIAAQVVSGIGFLGGGAIFATGGKPHGLTTAAALWSSAAVGLACGMGRPAVGVAVALVTVVALWPLDRVIGATIDPRAPHTRLLHAVVSDVASLGSVRRAVSSTQGVQLRGMTFSQLGDHLSAELVVHGRDDAIDRAVAAVSEVAVFVSGSSDERATSGG